jgi:sulfide:quinone oxidoreductase
MSVVITLFSTHHTWEMIEKNFKVAFSDFHKPSTPIKCGGAPHKIMYLACDYWRKKRDLDKCEELHYILGSSMIFGIKEYAETLEKELVKYNVHHYGALFNGDKWRSKTIEFETKELDENLKQN